MELATIVLARVAAFLEVLSLDPNGRSTAIENINAIASRYSFAKAPKDFADLDFQKGVVFASGKLDKVVIDQIQLFHNGLAIDTRSSTHDSIRVLNDFLQFAQSTNGAVVSPTRHHLVSQIVFRSHLKLSLLNPMLQPIADSLSEITSKDLRHPICFEPTAILIGADTTQLKVAPSVFSLERRSEAAFSENTYFSSAPLSTDEHVTLIERIEKSLTPHS